MHVKEINIKNRVYNYYFDSLVKAVEKSYNDLTIFLDSTKLTDKKLQHFLNDAFQSYYDFFQVN